MLGWPPGQTCPMTTSAGQTEPATRTRRDEMAVAFFGTWMIIGLFLDGWAHQANKPETFFSPWHMLLYSGFVAAVAWFGWDGRRRSAGAAPGDRWLTAGLVLFVTGAVGDGIWHEVFGIEVDLEALLSPTHLLLFIGGVLMVTLPLRLALADTREVRPVWRDWWPQAVTLTLATSVAGFFSMYLSAFENVGVHASGEDLQAYGVASILVTNLLLMAPTVFVLRRWDPPAGTFLLFFTVFGILMTGLEGFRTIDLVPAPIVGALVLEAARRVLDLVFAVALASAAMWSTYFVVLHLTGGMKWPVELWAGSIVLAAACSAAIVALNRGSTPPSVG